mmetsp:Transcript_25617/g.64354  ORF Transcript_25617/g.64354 Transcript_25617/m.64354 type:complete len:216 (+) Transcript_25617:2256-2903(+)
MSWQDKLESKLERAVVAKSEMIGQLAAAQLTELSVFDFDGTLVFTPDRPEGEEAYFKATGQHWPYSGWWGKPGTLRPPIVPIPCPQELLNDDVHKELEKAVESKTTLPILLTGRHAGLRRDILRILSDLKVQLPKELLFCKSGGDTFEFKEEVIRQALTRLLPNNDKSKRRLVIYEDREDHLPAFRELLQGLINSNSISEATIWHICAGQRTKYF